MEEYGIRDGDRERDVHAADCRTSDEWAPAEECQIHDRGHHWTRPQIFEGHRGYSREISRHSDWLLAHRFNFLVGDIETFKRFFVDLQHHQQAIIEDSNARTQHAKRRTLRGNSNAMGVIACLYTQLRRKC